MLDWLFSNPLESGTPAPDCTLPAQDRHMVALSSRGKNALLVSCPGVIRDAKRGVPIPAEILAAA